MRPEVKRKKEQKRRFRIRNKLKGTSARPRMSVRFTERNIYVQFIDDEKGQTLASASTRHKAQADREKLAANKLAAEQIGKAAAEAAKGAGITEVIFDRSGSRYVKGGKVDVLANAARGEGLKF
ncbi:MAG: 50S ribosomal protein L18 [Verrucomicrobiota bacterium]|jgi:large subunit ribosomal protein L18|nr:50S ribosomal protein L18 [Verrucomicrobiota bacterium]MDP6903585.1 50S ribosomal protein L18 [Verrucomicrobiota bacterium]MEE2715163.1 50S ribosomal protein L18 [Verrucomicrobiota bacterium]MEE2813537.1 50S ribosomal protein L18 [Verrucomicrobiota bacterium]